MVSSPWDLLSRAKRKPAVKAGLAEFDAALGDDFAADYCRRLGRFLTRTGTICRWGEKRAPDRNCAKEFAKISVTEWQRLAIDFRIERMISSVSALNIFIKIRAASALKG